MRKILTLLFILTFTAGAYAQMHGQGMGMHNKRGPYYHNQYERGHFQRCSDQEILKNIGVSADVISEIQKVVNEAKARVEEYDNKIVKEYEAIDREYARNKLSEKSIKDQTAVIGKLKKERAELILNTRTAVYSKLTAEQRKALMDRNHNSYMKGCCPGKGYRNR